MNFKLWQPVYVHITDHEVVRTIGSKNINIDLDEHGHVVGVEILCAIKVTVNGQTVVELDG